VRVAELQTEIDELTDDCDKVLDTAGPHSSGRVTQISESPDLLRKNRRRSSHERSTVPSARPRQHLIFKAREKAAGSC
jgi:ElaB/YqjD/DUF883 family membrane-anchored ribosome-binding protein